MRFISTRGLFFGAGILLGVGVTCMAKSKVGKKAAVAIASKGLLLKDRIAALGESMKETVDDVVAEAKYVNEQEKASGFSSTEA